MTSAVQLLELLYFYRVVKILYKESKFIFLICRKSRKTKCSKTKLSIIYNFIIIFLTNDKKYENLNYLSINSYLIGN